MSSIGGLLRWARGHLADTEQAYTDAQALLCHLLHKDRAWLFAWSDAPVDAQTEAAYRELVQQRGEGVPVAHLTGTRGFWNLQLQVSPATLIPRPETEQLVEKALQLGDAGRALQVLDLGTGSGAIALALASERPAWRITAVERSVQALGLARHNAAEHGLHNVCFVHGSWFENVHGHFDLIVSNPPYVADADPHLSQGDLRFEPATALASGADGLDDIRSIVAQAPAHLVAGGSLLFEHGYDQGPACRQLLAGRGFVEVFTGYDLAGLERFSGGVFPP
jgi:release factor glutamine methyltransferase